MKGATALPPPNTIMTPRISRIKIIGISQNFFRSFKKRQMSFKNSMIIYL
tara:strand:- start:3514 stop:3663 length:150 start_codon:yes stop_codon:yes gene_type:complete